MSKTLEKRFGHLVADVARLVGTQFDQQARERLRLPRAQCRMVVYLTNYGEMNQAQLTDLLGVTPMTVVRILDRMEQGGWVKRLSDPNDRRAVRVVATAKAQRLVDKILALGDEVTAEAMQGLTATEQATLIDLLSRVKANISPREPSAPQKRRRSCWGAPISVRPDTEWFSPAGIRAASQGRIRGRCRSACSRRSVRTTSCPSRR